MKKTYKIVIIRFLIGKNIQHNTKAIIINMFVLITLEKL